MRPSLRGLVILAALIVLPAAAASAQSEPNPCTDPDHEGFEAECLPGGTAGHLHRHVCSYAWVEAVCSSTRFPDPGYATSVDPHPTSPLALRVGAVHEHSSYSDGDPEMIPRDYFRAGRTGHNTADAGGDTGVKLDFMFGSEHSDNTEIPITTAAVCADPSSSFFFIGCQQVDDQDHYWKWPATLRQAQEATTSEFTAARGFEWTNDYFNHMNVYFSTNFTNVKVDGSYLSMEFFWDWLREPVSDGGGADGLVTFNHPGGWPALTPFDGDLPHNQLLDTFPGGANWNDLAYVPDVDDNVVAMEVNGGDDIEWYVKALTRGWHIGAVANEDEHQREWATSADGKTLVLTRGTTVRDYYFAMRNHRTIAIHDPLVGGSPGQKATFPTIHYFAAGKSINDPKSTVLGGKTGRPGKRPLRFQATDLPANSRVALISNTTNGQATPIQLGAANAAGAAKFSRMVAPPASGEDWYFAVVCPAASGTNCGTNRDYVAVTAPIWFSKS